MNKLTETQAAYIAGLLDGEGCISYYNVSNGNGYRGYSTRIKVAMTDANPVYWLKDILGCGFITVREREAQYRRVFEWQTKSRVDIADVLEAVFPYLIVKKEQAKLLLNFLRTETKIHSRVVKPELVAKRLAQLAARAELERRLKELKIPQDLSS